MFLTPGFPHHDVFNGFDILAYDEEEDEIPHLLVRFVMAVILGEIMRGAFLVFEGQNSVGLGGRGGAGRNGRGGCGGADVGGYVT